MDSLATTPLQPTATHSERRGSREATARPLACSSCRKKKIKCQPGPDPSDGRCRACAQTQGACVVPAVDERRRASSKKLVRALQAQVAALAAELQRQRHRQAGGGGGGAAPAPASAPSLAPAPVPDLVRTPRAAPDNMLVRLCGGGRQQLNSDRGGRLRYFGPTSSLHLTESVRVTSSVLGGGPGGGGGGGGGPGLAGAVAAAQQQQQPVRWQDAVSPALEAELLAQYWAFQHQVIPVVHRAAFLADYGSGATAHCSRLLVHCLLARAAAISARADVRALALVADGDEANEDPPLLVRRCAALLDAELDAPGLTTLQALQLLSEIYCVLGNDTKGWLDAGGAGRLVFELGLHSGGGGGGGGARDTGRDDDWSGGGESSSTHAREVRQICFWSAFSFDRQWALYLGRPQMIKLDDVTVPRPFSAAAATAAAMVTPELRMAAAWASLLEIVGLLCDALNGAQSTRHRVATLDRSFRAWRAALDPALRHHARQSPAVFHLHMQHAAAIILLHRPLAQFGGGGSGPGTADDADADADAPRTAARDAARHVCIRHACFIAQCLRQFEACHGSLRKLSWVALHMISTAATTLMATLAEAAAAAAAAAAAEPQQPPSSPPSLVAALQTCLHALGALQESHLPTRRVRRLILHAMRLLRLEVGEVAAAAAEAPGPSSCGLSAAAPEEAPVPSLEDHVSLPGPLSVDTALLDWSLVPPAPLPPPLPPLDSRPHAYGSQDNSLWASASVLPPPLDLSLDLSLDLPLDGLWAASAGATSAALGQQQLLCLDEFLPLGNYGSQAEMLSSFESLF